VTPQRVTGVTAVVSGCQGVTPESDTPWCIATHDRVQDVCTDRRDWDIGQVEVRQVAVY
jgi:hypothetical protein